MRESASDILRSATNPAAVTTGHVQPGRVRRGVLARNTSFALLFTVISKAGFVGVRSVQLFRAPLSEGSCAWSLVLCGHHLGILNHFISEFVFCKWSQMGQQNMCRGWEPWPMCDPASITSLRQVLGIHSMLPVSAWVTLFPLSASASWMLPNSLWGLLSFMGWLVGFWKNGLT